MKLIFKISWVGLGMGRAVDTTPDVVLFPIENIERTKLELFLFDFRIKNIGLKQMSTTFVFFFLHFPRLPVYL